MFIERRDLHRNGLILSFVTFLNITHLEAKNKVLSSCLFNTNMPSIVTNEGKRKLLSKATS